MKTHLDISSGLNTITACGKSLHGWNIHRPKSVTEDRNEVTCLNCIRNMNKAS
jgi:hypothetical protein